MNIDQKFLTPNQYSRPQIPLTKVRGIVVHWVANPGSSAMANRNYFENLKNGQGRYASSHYIIGLEGEVIQCIPTTEVAYHANHRNSDTIGIECCHPDWTGEFNFETLKALKELLRDLCMAYKLDPRKDVIRHYDITGKDCPRWYVNNPNEWEQLREEVWEMTQKNEQHWAEEYYKKLNDLGITVHEKRFDDPITRGEVMALICRTVEKLKGE